MFKNKLKQKTKSANEYVKTFIKWIILATLTGGVGGIAGTFFNKCIVYVTRIRNKNEWIILLLPLGGLLIVFLYRVCKMEKNTGTNNVIKSVRSEEKVPFVLAPLIFVGTVITHLFGGSVGREGAALQLGGSIGEMTGRLLRLNENDMHVVRMCGMSTVFSALFGTPLTATIFALEVISVGIIHYSAFIPCLLSAVLSYKISLLFGVMPETYILPFTPFLSMATFAKTIVIGIVCAVVSIFFCVGIFGTNKLFTKWFKNPYIRVFVGGLIIVVLTFSLGTTDYNGAGMNIIDAAVLQGKAVPYAFLLKILFDQLIQFNAQTHDLLRCFSPFNCCPQFTSYLLNFFLQYIIVDTTSHFFFELMRKVIPCVACSFRQFFDGDRFCQMAFDIFAGIADQVGHRRVSL